MVNVFVENFAIGYIRGVRPYSTDLYRLVESGLKCCISTVLLIACVDRGDSVRMRTTVPPLVVRAQRLGAFSPVVTTIRRLRGANRRQKFGRAGSVHPDIPRARIIFRRKKLCLEAPVFMALAHRVPP